MPVLDSLRSTFTIQGSTMHCNTSMMMHEFRELSCVHIHKQLAFLSCAVSVVICMATYIARVWINQVRLPILLVVS